MCASGRPGDRAIIADTTIQAPPAAAARQPEFPTWFLAACVTAMVASVLWTWGWARTALGLGDTDDALRLVLVRELGGGRAGWWDQHLMRLQPPLGMDLHWSRLVDGGLVLTERAFGLVLDPAQAELAARTAWPFLWMLPAIAAAIAVARRLRGPSAALVCAALLAVNLPLYAQFVPGRIDHHNVQIALVLVTLAGAVRGGAGGLALAGLATGLGLAVGVEGLIFEALVGAALALQFLVDPPGRARPLVVYAGCLTASLAALFLIQTPPWRWGVSVCDALGLNLAAAVAVAGLGVIAAASMTARRSLAVRAAALALVGVAAAGVYAALQPACLHGPLGQADPRLWPVWLANINEMRSLFRRFPDLSNGFAIGQVLFQGLAVAAWLWLGGRREGRGFAWALTGAVLAAGVLAESQAQRMGFYAAWTATALVAAAIADFGAARLNGRILPMIALAVAASPTWATAAAEGLGSRLNPSRPAGATAACTAPSAMAALARLPPGLVLGEVDLGPYVLAATPHAVIAAPYHRMAWGILAADAALGAPAGPDQAAVRRLGASYVLECPANASEARRRALGPLSLQVRLDRGQVPAWLEPLSPGGAPLQVYRVRPPGP